MAITTYTSCLRIQRKDGVVLGLTDLDKDVFINDTELGLEDLGDPSVLVASSTVDIYRNNTWFWDSFLDSNIKNYTGYTLKFTSGASIGEEAVITLHEPDASTFSIYFSPGLSFADGDTYEIYDRRRTYLSAAGYTPTNLQSTSDNAVNNADVEGVLSSIGVQREDILGGRYDFAKLHIFIYDYVNNTVIKKLGTGSWGECTLKEGSFVAEYRSLSQQLQQTVGRTYNPECDEQFGGPRCTIDLASYTHTGTIVSLTDNFNFVLSSTHTDGILNYGKITFTSGLNTDLYMEVKNNIGSAVELQLPMPFEVSVGDSYSVYEGCNKLIDTCKNKFSNHINFQGFPYIPGQDAITRFGGQ